MQKRSNVVDYDFCLYLYEYSKIMYIAVLLK